MLHIDRDQLINNLYPLRMLDGNGTQREVDLYESDRSTPRYRSATIQEHEQISNWLQKGRIQTWDSQTSIPADQSI